MSYVKQTWATGDVVTAEKMNYIENGIAGAGGPMVVTRAEENGVVILNKTWQEIYDAMASGSLCAVVDVDIDMPSVFFDIIISAEYQYNKYTIYTFDGVTYNAYTANGYPNDSPEGLGDEA